MPDLGLTLPLRISAGVESVAVIDAVGRIACYVYFSRLPEHASATKRVLRDEAVAIAQVTARALTEALARPRRDEAPGAEAPGA